jgi:hypothetical protein
MECSAGREASHRCRSSTPLRRVTRLPVVQTTKSSGFIGGAEVGTNYQIGKLVVGLEADWAGGDINGTSSSSFAAGLLNRSIGANTTWTGTVATRIGIAHDRWLVYGKAGSAFEHTNFTDTWTAVGCLSFPGQVPPHAPDG